MRRLMSMVLLCTASACDSAPSVGSPDANVSTEDAGSVDGGAPDASTPDGLTFSEDIYPMFVASGCAAGACHGSPLSEISPDGAGLLLYLGTPDVAWREISRTSVTTGRAFLVPGDPEASELVLHARDTNVPAGVLSLDGLATLERWVRDGADRGPEGPPRAPEPEPSTCTLTGIGVPPLADACLPRCTSETWDRIVACRSDPDPLGCQAAVFAEDPTPPADLATANGSVALDCQECADRQTESCLFEACPDTMLAYFRCGVEPARECGDELDALIACARSSPTFDPCRRARDRECVAVE